MHFLQSKYWREIKERLGNKTYEVGDYFFKTTKLPLLDKNVGYMPRPDLKKLDLEKLYIEGKKARCINIVIDPSNLKGELDKEQLDKFTNSKYLVERTPELQIHLQNNVVIDLNLADEELLKNMKQKHRYNLKLAQKKGVEVKIENSEESFKVFLKLYKETIGRQQYHGRNEHYLETAWKVLKEAESKEQTNLVQIATAYYQGEPLVSWFLINFDKTIYYPYGGSSEKDKNVMAPYALVWEIIQWGKKEGYASFDLFGIKEDTDDGYSRFKVGFGGTQLKYEDTLNLIIDRNLYSLFKVASAIRKKALFRT